MNRKIMEMRKQVNLKQNEEFTGPLQLLELTECEKTEIKTDKKREILRQTMFKFKLMRVRTKIGYHAFKKRIPI